MTPAPGPAAGRRLIWNADDFGYSATINAGIVRAHTHGALRGASVLAGGDAFEDAVRLARGMPGLVIGVHLAAVEMSAVLPAARLHGLTCAEGRLPASHMQFLARYALGRIPVEVVETEWEAQIARVRDAGLKPVYVDSHQHLHVLPGLFEATLRLMRRHAIHAVRTPSDAVCDAASLVRGAMLPGLFALGRWARTRARSQGFTTAERTLGIAAAGRLDAARIRSWLPRLRALPAGAFELVSHPGLGEAPGSGASRWGYHWAEELAAACDAELTEELRREGIRVVSWAGEVASGDER